MFAAVFISLSHSKALISSKRSNLNGNCYSLLELPTPARLYTHDELAAPHAGQAGSKNQTCSETLRARNRTQRTHRSSSGSTFISPSHPCEVLSHPVYQQLPSLLIRQHLLSCEPAPHSTFVISRHAKVTGPGDETCRAQHTGTALVTRRAPSPVSLRHKDWQS